MDRRQFLRSLVAAAVAAQLPALPVARRDALVDKISERFAVLIDGKPPARLTVKDLGDGYYHVQAECERNSGCVDLDFRSMNEGRGLCVADADYAKRYLKKHPDDLVMGEVKFDFPQFEGGPTGTTFSVYVKLL